MKSHKLPRKLHKVSAASEAAFSNSEPSLLPYLPCNLPLTILFSQEFVEPEEEDPLKLSNCLAGVKQISPSRINWRPQHPTIQIKLFDRLITKIKETKHLYSDIQRPAQGLGWVWAPQLAIALATAPPSHVH